MELARGITFPLTGGIVKFMNAVVYYGAVRHDPSLEERSGSDAWLHWDTVTGH